jgi:hypothetical protein
MTFSAAINRLRGPVRYHGSQSAFEQEISIPTPSQPGQSQDGPGTRPNTVRLEMEVTDLGPTQLKNIDRQIRAYSLQVGVAAKPKPAKLAEPATPVTPAASTLQKRRIGLAPLAAALAALLRVSPSTQGRRQDGHSSPASTPFSDEVLGVR